MVVTFKVMVEYIKLPPEHDPHKVFHNTCYNIPDALTQRKPRIQSVEKLQPKYPGNRRKCIHSRSTHVFLLSPETVLLPCLGSFNVFHLLISEHRNEPCPPVTSNV